MMYVLRNGQNLLNLTVLKCNPKLNAQIFNAKFLCGQKKVQYEVLLLLISKW